MTQTISSTGQIKLKQYSVPRLEFVDGKHYLDFNSIRVLCGGEKIAKTTLFCYLKQLPNVEENTIRYKNRAYYSETFILVTLRNLIFN
jgi:hypothetical protein